MVNNEYIVRNKDPPKNIKAEFCLEEIIKEKPSLDTDIMDFMAIAGWDYWRSPIYEKGDEKLRQKLKESVRTRRKNLSMGEKHMESRFGNWLISMGYFVGKLKTLRDLKRIIEDKGIIRPTMNPGIHYKTLAHFNGTLKEYEIESIKVGGKYGYRPGVLRNLKKYGLRPV